MREWLPTFIFTREAVPAYVSSPIRLVEINVPFGWRTAARLPLRLARGGQMDRVRNARL